MSIFAGLEPHGGCSRPMYEGARIEGLVKTLISESSVITHPVHSSPRGGSLVPHLSQNAQGSHCFVVVHAEYGLEPLKDILQRSRHISSPRSTAGISGVTQLHRKGREVSHANFLLPPQKRLRPEYKVGRLLSNKAPASFSAISPTVYVDTELAACPVLILSFLLQSSTTAVSPPHSIARIEMQSHFVGLSCRDIRTTTDRRGRNTPPPHANRKRCTVAELQKPLSAPTARVPRTHRHDPLVS